MGIQETYAEKLKYEHIDSLITLYKQTKEPIDIIKNFDLYSEKLIESAIKNGRLFFELIKAGGLEGLKDKLITEKKTGLISPNAHFYLNKIPTIDNLLTIANNVPNFNIKQKIIKKIIDQTNISLLIQYHELEPIKFDEMKEDFEVLIKKLLLNNRISELKIITQLTEQKISETNAIEVFKKYLLDNQDINSLKGIMNLTGFNPKEELIKEAYQKIVNSKIDIEQHYSTYLGIGGGSNYYITPSIKFICELKDLTGIDLEQEKILTLYTKIKNTYVSQINDKIINFSQIKKSFNYQPDSEFFKEFSYELIKADIISFNNFIKEFNLDYGQEFYDKIYKHYLNNTKEELKKGLDLIKKIKESSKKDFNKTLKETINQKLKNGNIEDIILISEELKDEFSIEPTPDAQSIYESSLVCAVNNSIYKDKPAEQLKKELTNITWLTKQIKEPIAEKTYSTIQKYILHINENFRMLSDLSIQLTNYSGKKTDYKKIIENTQ